MTQIQKLIEKFKKQPSTVQWKDLEKIIKHNGYRLERIKGSHHIYSKENEDPIIAPVHNGEIKIPYKKRFRKQIYNI
ncbi:hypothetical protein CSB09_00655 [Candidatus Gracilibacteria bacterium]|nr:MAG: hypothetical protein CSB09_00655 [Candidatus Gracilibacteria bacterium]